MNIRISVALVTRNRPESLERALKSWRAQSVQPWEIVVSDDSDPEQAKATEQVVLRYGCRYLKGPQRGLYANRNHVAPACQGTHILSADDDHEHPKDFLEQLLAAAERESETVWCLGEVYSWDEFNSGNPWFGPGQINPHGVLEAVSDDPSAPCWALSDGATLYPRGVFDLGLRFYDGVRFGDSYKEFGCLLYHCGWRIRPLRGTGVIHHLAEVGRSFNLRDEELAATLFALLMFTFFYQPTLRNRSLAVSKLLLLLCRRGLSGGRIIRAALGHVSGRKGQVAAFKDR